MRGGRIAAAMSVVLVLAGLPALAGSALAESPPASATIDLSNPQAGITDPLAAVPALRIDCRQGQVDVNTATPEALKWLFPLESDPTISRLIAGRPWLKAEDTVSVPGITPDWMSTWRGSLCASQPVWPPASPPNVCVEGGRALDLQIASAAQIVKLGLPRTTAQAIVAARPLPQDLQQVIAPRIPGLSGPTVTTLLAGKRICVTPTPIERLGTAWRWATGSRGAVVSFGDYALIVPPGRVTQPNGAYASITPLPDVGGTLPSADGHIWGSWASGTTQVGIQLPWSAAFADLTPAMEHRTGSGEDLVSTGEFVRAADGRVTVAATSLSIFTLLAASCNAGPLTIVAIKLNPYCAVQAANRVFQKNKYQFWQDHGLNVVGSIQPGNGTPCGRILDAVSEGAPPRGVTCTPPDIPFGSSVSWQFTNVAEGNAGIGGINIAESGAVVRARVQGGTFTKQVASTKPFADPLDALERWALTPFGSGGDVFVPAGDVLTVTKGRGTGTTTVSLAGDPITTGISATITSIIGLLGPLGGDAAATLTDDLLNGYCAAKIANAGDLPGLVTAIIGCSLELVSKFAESVEGSATSSKAAKGIAATARIALLAVDIGTIAISIGTALYASSGQVALKFLALPVGGGGGGGGSPAGSTYIVRDPSTSKSFLVDGADVLDIKEPGVFLCLAKSRFVYDNGDRPEFGTATQTPATCSSGGVEWDFRPVAGGGNVPNNVILRLKESESTPCAPDQATGCGIGSWLINSSGEIQTIPQGGDYECLAYANPVIWEVPFSAIQAWPSVGTEPATCGSP